MRKSRREFFSRRVQSFARLLWPVFQAKGLAFPNREYGDNVANPSSKPAIVGASVEGRREVVSGSASSDLGVNQTWGQTHISAYDLELLSTGRSYEFPQLGSGFAVARKVLQERRGHHFADFVVFMRDEGRLDVVQKASKLRATGPNRAYFGFRPSFNVRHVQVRKQLPLLIDEMFLQDWHEPGTGIRHRTNECHRKRAHGSFDPDALVRSSN